MGWPHPQRFAHRNSGRDLAGRLSRRRGCVQVRIQGGWFDIFISCPVGRAAMRRTLLRDLPLHELLPTKTL